MAALCSSTFVSLVFTCTPRQNLKDQKGTKRWKAKNMAFASKEHLLEAKNMAFCSPLYKDGQIPKHLNSLKPKLGTPGHRQIGVEVPTIRHLSDKG